MGRCQYLFQWKFVVYPKDLQKMTLFVHCRFILRPTDSRAVFRLHRYGLDVALIREDEFCFGKALKCLSRSFPRDNWSGPPRTDREIITREECFKRSSETYHVITASRRPSDVRRNHSQFVITSAHAPGSPGRAPLEARPEPVGSRR